jgi:hypothetical protein
LVVRRRLLRLALSFALAATMPATAVAAVVHPQLGNWEGAGSNGIAISFKLVRVHHRIAIGGGLTVTVPTTPVLCPAGALSAAAEYFKQVTYTGPGSAPDAVGGPNARAVAIQTDPFASFAGRLRSSDTMVLSAPGPKTEVPGCGWPRTLSWIVHRQSRAPVSASSWTGTLTGPGGITGAVSAVVIDHGHIVDQFQTRTVCPGGIAASLGAPGGAEEFIDRLGRFAGPVGPSILDGIGSLWQGRFSAATLTGTLTRDNPCAPGTPVTLTFTAHPAAPGTT